MRLSEMITFLTSVQGWVILELYPLDVQGEVGALRAPEPPVKPSPRFIESLELNRVGLSLVTNRRSSLEVTLGLVSTLYIRHPALVSPQGPLS
jgi:hypothetical protein